MAKAKKYLWDGEYKGHYVRAWKEKREYAVQVWYGKKTADGEPEGDWVMPGVLGLNSAVDQAVLQSKPENKK